jgi:hypothetical protein
VLVLAAAAPDAPRTTAAPSLHLIVRTLSSVKPRGERRVPAARVAGRQDFRLVAGAAARARAKATPAKAQQRTRAERTDRVYAGSKRAISALPVASAAQPYDALDSRPNDPLRIALLSLAVVSLTYVGFGLRRRFSGGSRGAAGRH